MRTALALAAALSLLLLCSAVCADVFNMGPGLTSLETVPVGDPGNVGEFSGAGAGGQGPNRVCGAVGYGYRIGKFEVTAAQYCDFLNHKAVTDVHGLYESRMSEDGCSIRRSGTSGSYSYAVTTESANKPVNYVSYWNACRFANWLHNRQGDGDTESGAYTLNGYNGDDGGDIVRNAEARWCIPSEDEWYKAAYYRSGGTNVGYWDYPTQSDAPPVRQFVEPDPGNSANYIMGAGGFATCVGEFENSPSAYGTFDQGGNVWEWNEGILGTSWRWTRGGSFFLNTQDTLSASYRNSGWFPSFAGVSVGFRVAYVPEPSSLLALLCGIGALAGVRRRG